MSDYNEAPVSFNVKAVSPSGYDCMLTIRSDDSGDLMPRALKALAWLEGQGFQPTGRHYSNGTSNASNGNTPTCPTHNKPMKASKFGGFYCTVKIAEDGGDGKPVYCKQKVKA